jgi:hypothetical protein
MLDANPSLEVTPTGSEKEQTPPNGTPPADIPEETVRNHPLFKEIEGKATAAEREAKRYKGRLDRAHKGMTEEEETPDVPAEKPVEPTNFVTKEELWARDNAADLELYGDDQYKNDIAAGIPKDYALNNAKLRFQSNPDKARLERHQVTASRSSASTRNLESDDAEGFNPEHAARWGYSKETYVKQQQLKKARGR